MTPPHLEIERKYDVPDALAVPSLGEIGVVLPAGEVTLRAEYLDTDDGSLAARRIVLRRREGGADAGWHLKLPSGSARVEHHAPLGEPLGDVPLVPESLEGVVRGILRRRPVQLIARLVTHRTLLHIADEHGTPMVEIADDLVTASDVAAGTARVWREWEAELLPAAGTGADAAALLDRVEEVLLAAGAEPAASASKLATALGRTGLGQASRVVKVKAKDPAGVAATAALQPLVRALVDADLAVRLGEADGVHDLRTVIRRLRAVLAVSRKVLHPAEVDAVRDELGDFGRTLGRARDAEAVGALVREAGHGVDDDLLAQLAASRDSDTSIARDALLARMSSDAYLHMLTALVAFAEHPTLGRRAAAPAGAEFEAAIGREVKRVRARAKAIRRADDAIERAAALHAVRRAARRLRYAVEAFSSQPTAVLGKTARRYAPLAELAHDRLGALHDAQLLQQALRDERGDAEAVFAAGVLWEAQRVAAPARLAAAEKAITRLLASPR